MSEFHAVGGKYDIKDKWIGLDYATAFMQHPEHVDAIVIHESVHAVIAGTDYGQASHSIFRSREHFQHVSPDEALAMEQLIFFSQDFVQEGLATYMQVARIARKQGKKRALEWADTYLPSTYKEKLDKLRFLFDMGQRYRDMFTTAAYRMAMDNGFQQDAPKLDLLKDAKTLGEYILDPDHNPNKRLEALIETVKLHNWIVTKSIPEIATKADMQVYDVATKTECAEFSTYVANLTDKPYTFKAEDVQDPITTEELQKQTLDNLLVANLNLNLAENSEPLWSKQDFLHYADVFDTVFVNYHDDTWNVRETLRKLIGEYPDVALVGFTKTGEKYIYYCSKETAEKLFDDELIKATLVVKWGGYSLADRTFIWSKKARRPDVVWYNSPNDISKSFDDYMKIKPSATFKHLHIGATLDHPLQTLLLTERDVPVLHVAMDFGNARISKVVKAIEQKSALLDTDDLRKLKQHINNFLVLQGMLRMVDWVETMIVQTELKYRTD